VGARVRKKLAELKTRFPDDVDYVIAYDTTPYIQESVMDVVRTLFQAVALVAVVVLLFLQNWRAALIPLIAVPVAIIGTFAVVAAVRFSLNNISLFGLVLAIGIVVDDAIVVVENVQRWLEQGLAARGGTQGHGGSDGTGRGHCRVGTLARLPRINGPVMVTRYNLYPAAPISGNSRPGVSSGEAIADVGRLAEQTLPRSMSTEWTELMFMQIRAGNTAMDVFGLAVVFVFLAMAALYESWLLPLAVILVVPLCLLCSVGGVLVTHRAVDIFVQIGLIVLVGLACKNSILIVEFAQYLHREGQPRYEATRKAVRLRLRPILMTSFAFILGVVPLVIASGAGAEMRRSLWWASRSSASS
jgi:multidrug efflux pump subunit AcrB